MDQYLNDQTWPDAEGTHSDFFEPGAETSDNEDFVPMSAFQLGDLPSEMNLGSDHSLLVDLISQGIEVPPGFEAQYVANEVWGDVENSLTESPLPEDYAEDAFPNIESLWDVSGSPAEDMALLDMQDDPFSCAVATANMMFRSIGLDPGEPLLAHVFEELGVYDPAQGSAPHLIDDAINAVASEMGIEQRATEFSGFSLETLKDLLDAGVRPLIAVDASELVDPLTTTLNELGLVPDSGHAVQLTGLIESDQGTTVVLNDPDKGAGIEVPIEMFLDAAEDFGFSGVALV